MKPDKLLKKDYEIDLYLPLINFKILGFRFSFFERKYTIKYKQGSFRDILRLAEDVKKSQDILDYTAQFISNHSKLKKSKLKKYFISSGSALKIFKFILKTYCKGYFSDDVLQEKENQKEKVEKYVPQCLEIAFLSEKTGNTFNDIMDMTWEQIREFSDAVIWNLNEASKEGKKRNERKAYKMMCEEGYNEDKAKKALAILDAKLNKNG